MLSITAPDVDTVLDIVRDILPNLADVSKVITYFLLRVYTNKFIIVNNHRRVLDQFHGRPGYILCVVSNLPSTAYLAAYSIYIIANEFVKM